MYLFSFFRLATEKGVPWLIRAGQPIVDAQMAKTAIRMVVRTGCSVAQVANTKLHWITGVLRWWICAEQRCCSLCCPRCFRPRRSYGNQGPWCTWPLYDICKFCFSCRSYCAGHRDRICSELGMQLTLCARYKQHEQWRIAEKAKLN